MRRRWMVVLVSGLLLTSLIGSGFAGGSVGISPTTQTLSIADNADEPLGSGATYWQGRRLWFNNGSANGTPIGSGAYEVHLVEEGVVVEEVAVVRTNANGSAILNTSDLSAGNYVLTTATGTPIKFDDGIAVETVSDPQNAEFELVEQTLALSTSDPELTTAGSETTLDLVIDSNRGSYNLTLKASELNLTSIFPQGAAVNGNHSRLRLLVGGDTTFTGDVSGVTPGEYTIVGSVRDTPASGQLHFIVGQSQASATTGNRTPLRNGGTYYQGQRLTGTATANASLTLRVATTNTPVQSITANNSGAFIIRTTGLSPDQYELTNSSNTTIATFQLQAQALQLRPETAITYRSGVGSILRLTVRTNRPDTFDLILFSNKQLRGQIPSLKTVQGNTVLPNVGDRTLVTIDYSEQNVGNILRAKVGDTTARTNLTVDLRPSPAFRVSPQNLTTGVQYYGVGRRFTINASQNVSETWGLRKDGRLIKEFGISSSPYTIHPDHGPGTYYLRNRNGSYIILNDGKVTGTTTNRSNATWTIRRRTLRFNLQQTHLQNEGSNLTATLTIRTDEPGEFNLVFWADQLNQSQLLALLPSGNRWQSDEGVLVQNIADRSQIQINASGISAGRHTIAGSLAGAYTNASIALTIESPATLGEVNGDGAINTGDVIQVQRSIVGLSTDPAFSAGAADVNQDGNVNTGDVIQIQRYIVGLSSVLD